MYYEVRFSEIGDGWYAIEERSSPTGPWTRVGKAWANVGRA